MNTALVLLTVATLAVIAVHVLLARKGPLWAGAVVPALWVTAVAVWVVRGDVTPGRPYLVCAGGLVMLLWLWGSEHQSRRRRARTDESHVDAGRER